ncbi:NEK protein kinase [Phytophthora nicotianae]|uniref:non-specific serine/threonine protein kinase n=1 Tax=Phytophthora nicotianae TaxID=4792 RepID=W2K3Q7_PHYNI|nr:NEK protein kinase [Phytophthora nicotianae]
MQVLPTKLRDGFKQLAHIGRGTYGDVFLCEHVESGGHVCLKEMDLTFLSYDERQKCLNEVELLKQLPAHPNIVGFREAFWMQSIDETQQVLVLVLEHANDGDLEQYLRRSCIKEEEVRRIFLQLVRGVHHLHSHRVVHRDLKCGNVLLFGSGRVVLGDFGTSKLLPTTGPDQALEAQGLTSTVVGSPHYMSPELLEGESHGFATDIWSLGCVLYEMLSGGKPAFNASSYPAVVFRITQGEYDQLDSDLVSSEARDLVARMLQKEPHNRPSITEILQSAWFHTLHTKELKATGLQVDENSPSGEVVHCQATRPESTTVLVQPLPTPVVSKTIQVSLPPAPDIRKGKPQKRQFKRKEDDYLQHKVVSPLIRFDELPPPPPMLPSRKNNLAASPFPLKHHHLQQNRLPMQPSPEFEIRGVRITGTARPSSVPKP